MSVSRANTPPSEPATATATNSNNNADGESGQQSLSSSSPPPQANGASHNHNNNSSRRSSSAQHSGTTTTTADAAAAAADGAAAAAVDKLSPDQDIFINPADGLPNEHPTLPDGETDSDAEPAEVDPDSFDDLPTSIIVTNIHSEVFADPQLKQDMEDLFRMFSESATFQWLRSFRRLRVNYDNAVAAANARIKLHQYEFNKRTVITCYFAQPVTPVSNKNLQPPAPVKQFLISPPASPPAGWEPREENEPLVNHDLLAALASLTPGESHELHPQSDDHPAIIVHTAMLPETGGAGAVGQNAVAAPAAAKTPIAHTKCPERA